MTAKTIPAVEAFKVGRFGPKLDPRDAHIICSQYAGPLEVTGVEYQEFGCPGFVLLARTFDRSRTFRVPMHDAQVLPRR